MYPPLESFEVCGFRAYVDRLREVFVLTRGEEIALYSPPKLPKYTRIIVSTVQKRPLYVQTTEDSIIATAGVYFLRGKPIQEFPFMCSNRNTWDIKMIEREESIIVTDHEYNKWYGNLTKEYNGYRIYANYSLYPNKIDLGAFIERVRYMNAYLPRVIAGWLK